MNISPDSIVREVVKLNFGTAPLFNTNNFEYFSGVNKTIFDTCRTSECRRAISKLSKNY